MAGVAVLNTGSLKTTSLNQILSWFGEDKKTSVGTSTLFHEQGWFHRCVDLRAKSIQNMPWTVTKSGSDNVLWDHEMPDIPEELAFAEHLPRLLYVWEASLVTVGRAYTLKESDGRSIDRLFYFNPLKVEPVKSASSGITQYRRTVNSGVETYDAEDMIALFHPDPFIENGPGFHTAGAKNAQVLRALDGFLVSFLDKGLIKATILSVEGAENVQPDQLQKLKKSWKDTLAGWFNGGDQAIFNSKVTPHTVGEGLGDLNDSDLTKEQREALCAALGIPLSLMMSNAANFATAELDHVNYHVFTVIPEAKFMMRELNRQLFAPLDYRFSFHPERLEVIQRYELDKAAKVVQVTGGPVLTRDEGRELLGYKPLGTDEAVIDARDEDPRQITEGAEDMGADEAKGGYAYRGFRLPDTFAEDVVKILRDSDAARQKPVDVEWKAGDWESDLAAWRRKIKSKGRDCKFSPDHLNDYEAAIIRERLASDMELDEVFSPPFVGF